ARATLAADILRRRMEGSLPLRFDLFGSISVLGDDSGNAFTEASQSSDVEPDDVRLRVAGTHQDKATVERLLAEVMALYTCGPAGGAGIRTAIRSRLHSTSCLIPREQVTATYRFLD
ncbi:MAG TPA: hypothetical protein VLD18_08435, partial [Verrucomicrobiae bacterium]|nr:hypothetical protein [Verrucomicrobiae bacterium]